MKQVHIIILFALLSVSLAAQKDTCTFDIEYYCSGSQIQISKCGKIDNKKNWQGPFTETAYIYGVFAGFEVGIHETSGYMKHGQWHGKVLTIHKSKSTIVYKKEEHYQNGKLQGKFAEWGRNGKLVYTGKYRNGYHQGEWLLFDSTGVIRQKEIYKKKESYHETFRYRKGKIYESCLVVYNFKTRRLEGGNSYYDQNGKKVTYDQYLLSWD